MKTDLSSITDIRDVLDTGGVKATPTFNLHLRTVRCQTLYFDGIHERFSMNSIGRGAGIWNTFFPVYGFSLLTLPYEIRGTSRKHYPMYFTQDKASLAGNFEEEASESENHPDQNQNFSMRG